MTSKQKNTIRIIVFQLKTIQPILLVSYCTKKKKCVYLKESRTQGSVGYQRLRKCRVLDGTSCTGHFHREVVLTDREVVTTDREVVLTDREVVSTDREVVLTDRQVVLTDRQVVLTDREVVLTDREVLQGDVKEHIAEELSAVLGNLGLLSWVTMVLEGEDHGPV